MHYAMVIIPNLLIPYILLLDYFMSELDSLRRTSFLENIKNSQVILTCTDKIDLERVSDIFYVDNGICIKE